VNNLKKEQTSDQNFQSSLIFFPSADVRKGSLHPKGGGCKKAKIALTFLKRQQILV